MAGKLRSDSFNYTESNNVGGDLPRAATAADRASQAASFPAVVRGPNGGFRWRGWSENDKDELRIKIQVVASFKIGGIDGEKGWVLPQPIMRQTAAFRSVFGDSDEWI